MTGTALVPYWAGPTLMRLELNTLVRREATRNSICIHFPLKATPRKWAVGELLCFVRSGPMSTNGYVAVPPTHPWYKIHYSECPLKCGESWCDHTPEAKIEVHGGLTFSGLAAEGWVFGFDTGHYNDYIPGLQMVLPPWELNHWDVGKVAREVDKLAKQLENVRRQIT